MSIRRVNLIAGPGHRKTTVYHQLLSALKSAGEPVEGVHEVAKKYIFKLTTAGKTGIGIETQMQIFNEQLEEELVRLSAGVPLVINEGCAFLCYCHARFYGQQAILKLLSDEIAKLDEKYPALNIFLIPTLDTQYNSQGRYQNQSDAVKLHACEQDLLLLRYGAEVRMHSTDDLEGMLQSIAKARAGVPAVAD